MKELRSRFFEIRCELTIKRSKRYFGIFLTSEVVYSVGYTLLIFAFEECCVWLVYFGKCRVFSTRKFQFTLLSMEEVYRNVGYFCRSIIETQSTVQLISGRRNTRVLNTGVIERHVWKSSLVKTTNTILLTIKLYWFSNKPNDLHTNVVY